MGLIFKLDSFFNLVTISGNMPACRLSYSHSFHFGNQTMGKKQLKFVLIPDATEEIKNTLLMQFEPVSC